MVESLLARFNGLPLSPTSVYMSCYFWRTTLAALDDSLSAVAGAWLRGSDD
jgi:hypothetical protein